MQSHNVIANSIQDYYKVLGKVGSVFSLQRENPLPTYHHQEDDLMFNSRLQEWLRSNERVIAILLSSLKGKIVIECQKAFNKGQYMSCREHNEPTQNIEALLLCSLSCQSQDKEQRTEFFVRCLGSSMNLDTIQSCREIQL
jgi:hypothetical protein